MLILSENLNSLQSTVIQFRIITKNKIYIAKNWFLVNIVVILLFFLIILKNTECLF